MIWEIAAIIATVLLFLALGYLYYSGLFYPVHIVIRKPYEGSLPIAYKYCVSNYNACGTVFQEFVSATSNETQLIGMYYDDPDDPAVVSKTLLNYHWTQFGTHVHVKKSVSLTSTV